MVLSRGVIRLRVFVCYKTLRVATTTRFVDGFAPDFYIRSWVVNDAAVGSVACGREIGA